MERYKGYKGDSVVFYLSRKAQSKKPSYLIMSEQSQVSVFSPVEEYNIKLHDVLLTAQMKSEEVQNIIKDTYS